MQYDRRTKLYRRRMALFADYANALGGWAMLTPTVQLRISNAAELQIAAEITQQRFLAGEGATADDVVRVARAAAQALKALGIATAPAKSAAPTLSEYLRAKGTAAE